MNRHSHQHAHAFEAFGALKPEGLVVASRRNLLKASFSGIAGLSLPRLLQAREPIAQGGAAAPKGKSVILLWMTGGPSQIDTWDPKPDRPIQNRGPFGVIGTTLPGVFICEHLPKQAAMLDRFNKEHTHTEDEVRFILQGSGVFHVHPHDTHSAPSAVFAIEVGGGDMISLPLGTRHWFDLCSDRRIRAIRLFQDMTGWTPYYLEDGVHASYQPLCLGPAWVAGAGRTAL